MSCSDLDNSNSVESLSLVDLLAKAHQYFSCMVQLMLGESSSLGMHHFFQQIRAHQFLDSQHSLPHNLCH